MNLKLIDKDFEKAYKLKYDDIKKAKSSLPKSGKSMFKWHKIQFHHISVGINKVDYLVHKGIVLTSFPLKKDRNEIYEFIDKYWEDVIFPFCKFIEEKEK